MFRELFKVAVVAAVSSYIEVENYENHAGMKDYENGLWSFEVNAMPDDNEFIHLFNEYDSKEIMIEKVGNVAAPVVLPKGIILTIRDFDIQQYELDNSVLYVEDRYEETEKVKRSIKAKHTVATKTD